LCPAVGNCLSASLLFSMRKYKLAPEPLSCEVEAEVGRNAENRLRVLGMTARLTLGVPAASLAHLDRVLAQFESFCTVTESIRQGFPVTVQVFDSTGAALK
ncbi:MAG: OsmC family protein, partial [Sphaerotilus sp.]|nr:OsmC family protein [Sphaerotilus sp.]